MKTDYWLIPTFIGGWFIGFSLPFYGKSSLDHIFLPLGIVIAAISLIGYWRLDLVITKRFEK